MKNIIENILLFIIFILLTAFFVVSLHLAPVIDQFIIESRQQ
jgi:hypothetical protein